MMTRNNINKTLFISNIGFHGSRNWNNLSGSASPAAGGSCHMCCDSWGRALSITDIQHIHSQSQRSEVLHCTRFSMQGYENSILATTVIATELFYHEGCMYIICSIGLLVFLS